MPAYVVTPITIEHIGGGTVEIRQETKALPCGVRVSRETYLIAMIPETAPPMVEQGTLCAVLLHVAKPNVVAPEDIVEILQSPVLFPLLPVEPPEVNALVYVGMQIGVEKSLYIFLVASHPLVSLAVVLAVALHKLVVLLFVWTHAVGRM